MKYPNLPEQKNRDTATFALFDFSVQGDKQRLDFAPQDVTGYRSLKQLPQDDLVLFIHVWVVS